MRNTLVPVISSPDQMARCTGLRHSMRQQREMQVVPAAGQRVQHGLLQDSSVCDDRGGLCAGDLQLVRNVGSCRVGFQYRQSQFQRGSLDRAGRELASASGGRVRAVSTATTSKCSLSAARRAGTAPRHQACRQRGFSTCVSVSFHGIGTSGHLPCHHRRTPDDVRTGGGH